MGLIISSSHASPELVLIRIWVFFSALCKFRPERGLKAFLPMSMDVLENLLEDTDVTKEQNLDEEFKFNLLIVSEVQLIAVIIFSMYD